MHREPDVGFDPGSPGSRPGPKAGAKPLRHPGIPCIPKILNGCIFILISFHEFVFNLFLLYEEEPEGGTRDIGIAVVQVGSNTGKEQGGH